MSALMMTLLLAQSIPLAPDPPAQRIAARPPLSFGSPMPTPDVEKWLVASPPTLSDPTRTYLVSFWSSAVTPARESLAVLSKIERDFAERGVTVVAITGESADAVGPLFQDGPMKERVTIPIGCDPDLSATKQFMEASWQRTVPVTFIASRGVIQWIGPPRAAESVLRAVLDGAWTPETRRAAHERDAATAERAARFAERIQVQLDRKEWDALLVTVGEMEGDHDPLLAREGRLLRVAMLQQAGRTAEAIAAAKALLQHTRDWFVHAEVAKTLVSPLFPKPDMAMAMMAALASTTLSGGKEAMAFIALSDVQARSGQPDNAIRSLQRAAALALPEEQDEIDARLAMLTAKDEPPPRPQSP